MGCLFSIFKLPFLAIGWIWRKWGFIGIGILVAIVAGIIIVAIYKPPPDPKIAALENSIPTATAAPYIITTPTRYYYVSKYTKAKDGVVTMQDFWELQDRKWIERKEPVTLTQVGIRIGKR